MSLNEKMIQIPAKNITNIFGEFDVHIKKIERTLGVTVIARDDHLKIIGTEQSTSDAVELFTQLNDLAERGNTITVQNVNYGLSYRKTVSIKLFNLFICLFKIIHNLLILVSENFVIC